MDIAKTCPECGPASRLVVRENGQTHEKFLGCSNYPACKYTEEMGIDMQLRAQGAVSLPGMEANPIGGESPGAGLPSLPPGPFDDAATLAGKLPLVCLKNLDGEVIYGPE